MFNKKERVLMVTILMSLIMVGGCSKKETTKPKEKDTKTVQTIVSSSKEVAETSVTSEIPKEVTDFKFDKTLLTKEDVLFEVGTYARSDQENFGTNKVEVKLYSNVPTKTSPETYEYPIQNSSIRIVDADGKELPHDRGELQVAFGSGVNSFIRKKNTDTKTVFTEYHFNGDSPKIKVRLVDDNENIMFESDWIEKTEKELPYVFDMYTTAEEFQVLVHKIDNFTKGAGVTLASTIEEPSEFNLEGEAKPVYAVTLHHSPSTVYDNDKLTGAYVLADDGYVYTYIAQSNKDKLTKLMSPDEGTFVNFSPEPWSWKEGLKEEYIAEFISREYITDSKPYWIVPSIEFPGNYILYVEVNGEFQYVLGMKSSEYNFHG